MTRRLAVLLILAALAAGFYAGSILTRTQRPLCVAPTLVPTSSEPTDAEWESIGFTRA